MTGWIFKVESNCADPAREQEFNDWYDNMHVPDLLKEEKAFMAASRYQEAHPQNGQGKFVALFELETDDIDKTMKLHEETEVSLKKRGRISDLLKITARGAYRRIEEATK
jgi:hypothetical protein